jgi:MoxR-like ATPase
VSTDRISEYLAQFSQARTQMVEQLRRAIVGQTEVIEQILAAIFTRGHCLLVGVPGLAKTLMVSSISQILDVSFKRIQFTPDLMPSDITGASSASSRGRSSPTSSSPTRSTAPRPRRRRRCCRPCRSGR